MNFGKEIERSEGRMDFLEARRRAERMLVWKSYETNGDWYVTEDGISRLAILGLSRPVRVNVWERRWNWWGDVTIQVQMFEPEDLVEWPLASHRITRRSGWALSQKWQLQAKLTSFMSFYPSWRVEAVGPSLAAQVIQTLINKETNREFSTRSFSRVKVIKSMNSIALRGDLESMSVLEAFNFAVRKWGKLRDERAAIAETWWKTFGPWTPSK